MKVTANSALVELAERNLEEFPGGSGIARLHRLEQLLESRPEIRLDRTVLGPAFEALTMSFLRGFSMSHLTLFPARAIPIGCSRRKHRNLLRLASRTLLHSIAFLVALGIRRNLASFIF